MKPKRRNPRSEVAMREAIKLMIRNEANAWIRHCTGTPWEIEISKNQGRDVVAIFDLRDCYRKRRPLKGVMKSIRKTLQGRGNEWRKGI